MPFVLDASVTMAWCFSDETTTYAESVFHRLQDDDALVPVVWPLEVANALLGAERRQRLSSADASRFVETVRSLPLAVAEVELSTVLTSVLALAREHGLSAYDASYLELAMREGLPLATQDSQLRDAAARSGVPLL